VNCIWFTAGAFCLCDKLGIIYAAESIQSYGKGGFSHTLAHLLAASGRIMSFLQFYLSHTSSEHTKSSPNNLPHSDNEQMQQPAASVCFG
jgi:hypothetical protein